MSDSPTLILVEHDGQAPKSRGLEAVTFAKALGRDYVFLVIGSGVESVARALVGYGAKEILVADDDALAHPLADRYAAIVETAAKELSVNTVAATSSTFAKDILPRTAALIDAPMMSDVTDVEAVEGGYVVGRLICAGTLITKEKVVSERCVFTNRPSDFDAPEASDGESPIRSLDWDASAIPAGTELVSKSEKTSNRPELTEASIIASGGRPLKDRETFEKHIGALADALGAAVGTTRAAVDAGIAPNDWQVGQTGKVVSPDLYIGVALSGSVQHMAGMKDSKVIVAINNDPEAPIFKVATYGLVADLFDAVPELIETLKS